MASKALDWDESGKRLYETGVSKGVFYKLSEGIYPKGITWSGLIKVTESPEGAEPTALYADNIKYLNIMSAEEFKATIEAYMYPPEFMECDGSAEIAKGVYIGQQDHVPFGMCYRTEIGNDNTSEHGYKIHIIYGAQATPSEKDYNTVNDNPEAITFSWEINTTPVKVSGFKPTATLTIDSTAIAPEKLTELEKILYGSEEAEARLPLPDEIKNLVGIAA